MFKTKIRTYFEIAVGWIYYSLFMYSLIKTVKLSSQLLSELEKCKTSFKNVSKNKKTKATGNNCLSL